MKLFIIIKLIIFTSFGCIISLNVAAQDGPFSNIIDVKIPVDAKIVKREKLYESDKALAYSIIAQGNLRNNLFEIGNMLLKFIPLEGSISNDAITCLIYPFIYHKKNASFYKEYKIAIINAETFCAQFETRDAAIGEYFFTAVGKGFKNQITILLEYKIGERKNADKIFKDIIQTLKMK